jgi:hypothetical protein
MTFVWFYKLLGPSPEIPLELSARFVFAPPLNLPHGLNPRTGPATPTRDMEELEGQK